MPFNTKKIFPLFLFIVMISLSGYGQKEKYQSLFIYNFTKHIEWPKSYNVGEFVIGVIGSSDIIESLNSMASRKKRIVTGQIIEVKKFNTIAEIGKCNILFVSKDVSWQLSQIDNATASKPILIVTDSPGLAAQGSIINFVEKDGKIKFELNEEGASSRGLAISSSLANLAIII